MSRACPSAFLEGFKGNFQVGGYAGYNEVFNYPGISHAACWAHVRREFENALETDPAEAIAEIRKQESLPVTKDLKEYLVKYPEKALPKSRLGKAIEYAFGQWEWLMTYLGDGRVEIDNNDCGRELGARRFIGTITRKGLAGFVMSTTGTPISSLVQMPCTFFAEQCQCYVQMGRHSCNYLAARNLTSNFLVYRLHKLSSIFSLLGYAKANQTTTSYPVIGQVY